MEALTDAVGLWVIGFGLGVLDVVNGQVELIIMGLRLSTILCPSIRQNTNQTHALFC